MSDDAPEELQVTTPAGSLKIRGTDWVGIVSLLFITGIGFAMYSYAGEIKMQSQIMVNVLKELTDAQKDATKQQRLLACIVSRPESERKREFESPNSFCQQITR